MGARSGRRSTRGLAVLVVAGLALACAPRPALAGAPPGPCDQPAPAGTSQVTISSGGLTRTAVVHVPQAAAGQRLPLLLALHGAGGEFFESYSGFSILADAEGFVVVYPDTVRNGLHSSWNINDHRRGAPDDVKFVSDLLDHLEAGVCVDARRVYATGVSNGGGMAVRLACQLSDRLAAIATVAGGYRSQPACHPLAPVSVMEVHGTNDGTVPYAGERGTRAGSVSSFLRDWTMRDVCHGRPQVHHAAPRVLELTWSRCAHGTTVEHLEIVGGGHQLPGAAPSDRGQAATVDVPWWVWSFLAGHVRAAPYPTRAKA